MGYREIIDDYARRIEATDHSLAQDDLISVIHGILGEIGDLASSAKKIQREGAAYASDERVVDIRQEEFGDMLWYFAALCRRLNCDVAAIFDSADQEKIILDEDKVLIKMARSATELLDDVEKPDDILREFASVYLQAIQFFNLSLSEIIVTNIEKTYRRFAKLDISNLPVFDESFPKKEQLPWEFTIEFRNEGDKIYVTCGMCGRSHGDPLNDSIASPDGYRFHDVFHATHAAVLHWSPVFRKLLGHKRKSKPKIDDAQDGGRASVIEEGLSAWLFSRAKEFDFFEGRKNISFDILKVIEQFVRGYEIEQCPLSLWERAILQGYEVFREMKKNDGGKLIGDRRLRRVRYEAL